MTLYEFVVMAMIFFVLANGYLIDRVAKFRRQRWPEIKKRIKSGGLKAL